MLAVHTMSTETDWGSTTGAPMTIEPLRQALAYFSYFVYRE